MRLAPDPITIAVDGVAITLRPSLGAAYRLNRDPGFQELATGVLEGDLPLIARMIEEASGVTVTPEKLLHATLIDETYLGTLADALLAYMALLIGVDGKPEGVQSEPANATGTKAKGITRAEFYDKLFAYGTGWLNWSPTETWAASPAEIMAAYEGRIDLLKSIFGDGGEKDTKARQSIPLSERVKAVMQSLGGKVVKRPKKGEA